MPRSCQTQSRLLRCLLDRHPTWLHTHPFQWHAQITEPLRESNLIGNGPQVLADIDLLGNDFAMGNPGTCGKDGQGVPVGDGQPTLRVKSLTIGGTAA